MRFSLKTIALAIIVAASHGGVSFAQSWPTQPVTFFVAYGAGGGADQQARIISKFLSEKLGQPFIVQNKPGGGGTVAATLVKASAPDGYTLLFTTSSTFTFEPLFSKLNESGPELRHIGIMAQTQEALVASPKLAAKDFSELIKEAKQQNRSLKFASSYQLDRILMATIAKAAGIKIIPVPMQGGTGVITAVMGDQVDFGVSGSTWGPYVERGQMKLLAAATRERFASHPELPTLRDLGYDVATEVYFMISVPHATPDAVVRKIEAALREAAEDPANIDVVVARNKMRNFVTIGEAETTALVSRQADYYRKLVESVGHVSQ
jgi:tripartite-type tricarboxylate transporter receptor subunit TctC